MAEKAKAPKADADTETWAKYAAGQGIVVSSHVSRADIVAALQSEGIVTGTVVDRDVDGDRSSQGNAQPDGDETTDEDAPGDEPRKRNVVSRTDAGGAVRL